MMKMSASDARISGFGVARICARALHVDIDEHVDAGVADCSMHRRAQRAVEIAVDLGVFEEFAGGHAPLETPPRVRK